jgi:hypothetical protein
LNTTAQFEVVRVGLRGRVAAILLAVFLGLLSYLVVSVWPVLFPKAEFSGKAAADCDLRKTPCVVDFGAGRFIRLAFEPRIPTPNQPLRAFVETGGLTPQTVAIEFSGIDMNMGLISQALLDTDGGSFTGDVTLPACVRGRMVWRASVTAESGNHIHRAAFEFEVGKQLHP